MATDAAKIEAVFLRDLSLCAFIDPLRLRDPSGRSARPNLTFGERNGEPGVLATGPFNLHLRYAVTREQGVAFCQATGDANPIHSEGSVVPGAYTAAKLLLAVEVVFPDLELTSFSMKFTSIATYGRPLLTKVRIEPTAEGARMRAETLEEGVTIAEMNVECLRSSEAAPVEVPARRKISVPHLRTARTFIQSLGIMPHAYFRKVPGAKRSAAGLFYPRAFLAALPSGAMVRQLRGEGGLLNKLTLEFDPEARVPISVDAPLVELEQTRKRSTFNRILTAIKSGIRTSVRGTALVLTGEALAKRSRMRALPAPEATGLAGAPAPAEG